MRRDNYIRNQGYINKVKLLENTRIVILNPSRMNLWDNSKMQIFTDTYKEYQIDIGILNETNIKWNPKNIDRIHQYYKEVSREIEVIGADSTM